MDRPMETEWTPVPFNLLAGNPFSYSPRSISEISTTDSTEAFNTRINLRDKQCVVCGQKQRGLILEHAHIVPKVEDETWEEMRGEGFIPDRAKSVAHEARNGVLMCRNHHSLFDGHYFFVRWVPESKRFCFVNHSRIPELEEYHGHAINLDPDDRRVPFHGAFLFHEMRVRGRWPLRADRPISLPIGWQRWIPIADDNDDHDDEERHGNDAPTRDRDIPPSVMMRMPQLRSDSAFRYQRPKDPSSSTKAATRQQPRTLTLTSPFANPAELSALKRSFSQQPNWKAAVLEGESWEGTAKENITKWRGLESGSS